MVIHSENENGEKVIWDDNDKQWKYPDEEDVIDIGGKKKRVCSKCNKPRIDINGVVDCDFCLQGLSVCDLIDYACCGHNDPDSAYISFKDGRRWILDKEWSRK